MPEKIFGDHELKNRIAQKFETLIIKMPLLGFVTEAWMSQRFGQKQRIAKLITDSFFERMHGILELRFKI
jgi:hypothetical protein